MKRVGHKQLKLCYINGSNVCKNKYKWKQTFKAKNNKTNVIKFRYTSTLYQYNSWKIKKKKKKMFYCFKDFLYHSPFSKRNETLPVYWTTENSSRTQCTSAQIFIRTFVLVENGNLYTEQNKWLRISKSNKTTEDLISLPLAHTKWTENAPPRLQKWTVLVCSTHLPIYEEMFKRRKPSFLHMMLFPDTHNLDTLLWIVCLTNIIKLPSSSLSLSLSLSLWEG